MVKRWTWLTLLIRLLSLGSPGRSGPVDVMRGYFPLCEGFVGLSV